MNSNSSPSRGLYVACDERSWSKKLWKVYRMLFYMEKRKYGGITFSEQLKGIANFYALKFNYWGGGNRNS